MAASGGSLKIKNQAEANGIAYGVIANAAALAVQDATDYLRFVGTVSATVVSISVAKFAVTKQPKDLEPIPPAESAATNATQHLIDVGNAAASVLQAFS